MDAPRFLRRDPSRTSLETDVRSLVAGIQSSQDKDTASILAGAINLYQSSMLRFRRGTVWSHEDMEALFQIWLTLLDVRRQQQDFSSGKEEVEPLQPETDTRQ